MLTAGDFLNQMRSFIGIVENPPRSNRTPIGQEFGVNGVAWCAETVSVAAGRIGFDWFHTYNVGVIIGWAKSGYKGLTWHTTPQPGDVVCYGNGEHAGAVEAVSGGVLTTIEGNWADSCRRLTRSVSDSWITGYARLPFAAVQSPAPPSTVPGSKWPPTRIRTPGLLRQADTGQIVASLQIRLNKVADQYRAHVKRVVAPGTVPVTGIMDARTGSMVKWFQRTNGLGSDGVFGPQTSTKLRQVEHNFGITY